jgi:ABC-type transport system substrate-binding protein
MQLYQEALKSTDPSRRKAIATEMQQIDHTSGTYIIPLFAPIIDGVSEKLKGVHTSRTGQSLGNYDFKRMWVG